MPLTSFSSSPSSSPKIFPLKKRSLAVSSSASSSSSSPRAPSPPRAPSVARAPSPSLPSSAAKESKKKKKKSSSGDSGDTAAAASVAASAAAAASSPSPPQQHLKQNHHQQQQQNHQQNHHQQQQQQRPRPLEACRALVLDASHRPLDVLPWTRAVSLYLSRDQRVEVLSFYDGVGVRSAYAEHRVPAVLRARVVVNVGGSPGGGKRGVGGSSGGGSGAAARRKNKGRGFASSASAPPLSSSSSSIITSASLRAPAPSRRNVIARDNGTCAFCFLKVFRVFFLKSGATLERKR